MTPHENFSSIAPKYMVQFMNDFDCNDLDASAVFGNAGYESLGFTKLQEIKPVVKGSRGGYGWFQWTGPRRKAFEAYCKRNDLDPSSNDANYKFLFVELTTTEKHALPKLKAAKTLGDKVIAFEESFERAGVKRYPERIKWAQIAFDALQILNAKPTVTTTTPVGTPEVQVQQPTGNGKFFGAVIAVLLAIGAGILHLFGVN